MNSGKSFFTHNFWVATGLTALIALGTALTSNWIDDSFGGDEEFPMTAIWLLASAVIFTLWTVSLETHSKKTGDRQRSISSLNLKDLWQKICNGEAGLPSRIMGPLAVACFTGSVILFILCVLGWDDRSREGKPLGIIDVGRYDEEKLGLIIAVSALVFIKLLVRTFSKKSKHKLGFNSQFGHVIRSPILPALVTASVVIIIATGLIAASIEEVFNLRGDSEYLMMGILFLGSGSLMLMWMFGLGRISQQAKALYSSPADSSKESDDDVQDETSKDDDAGEDRGLWSGAIKPFIKNSSGLLILLMTALAPISIATYFLLNPKDGNLNEFGLIQIWALPVGGFVGWLFLYPLSERTRWIRTFAKICLGLILFISGGIGLFVSIENYRGERAWSNFKEEWKAKGISFDKESHLPSEIPPEKNFANTPLLAPLQSSDRRSTHSRRLGQISAATEHSYRSNENHDRFMRQGLVMNLSGWQTYFRENSNGWPVAPTPQTPAQDILLGLSHFKIDFEQLRADSIIRPSAHYGECEPGVVPSHHSAISKLCSFLRLRMRAFLQDNQPDAALEDVRLLYFLAGTIKTGPEIDSTMLYTKLCMAGTVPIWEGLVLNKWRTKHLIEIQSILIRHDLLKSMKPALLNITIGSTLPFFKSLEGPKDQRRGFLRDVAKFNHVQLKPRGWIRQNQVYLCREVLENLLPQFDGEAHRYYPRKQSYTPPKRYSFLMSYSGLWALPALKIPEHQTQLDLLIIACSLEHHRITEGKYPESLNAINLLDGNDLPQEVFTGHPYIYQLQHQKPGAYKLRSVGSNLKDDQGDPESDIVYVPKGKIAPRGN